MLAPDIVTDGARTETKRGLARHPARILAVERPSPSLLLLRLERPPGYTFDAGQFCYVYEPGHDERRAYSIASPPQDARHIDLCIKKVKGGTLSPSLYEVDAGQELEITPALGGFRFATPPGREAVFLATGTGVAPFRSMLLDLEHQGDERGQWLLLGSGVEANLPYATEFQDLERRRRNFHYIPILSKGELYWQGDRGWIQEAFLKRFAHRTDFDAYVCGVKRMVDDVLQLLRERGHDAKRIHLERYV